MEAHHFLTLVALAGFGLVSIVHVATLLVKAIRELRDELRRF